MKKALLIGSSPKLINQLDSLSRDDLENYETVCCMNNIFNDDVLKLYRKYSIVPDYYFFSDFAFTNNDEGRKYIPTLKVKKKILCTPPKKPNCDGINYTIRSIIGFEKVVECSFETSSIIDHLGGYHGAGWASTGMYSLGYLLLDEDFDSVDLIGFSFLEGELHYYGKGTYPHNGMHNTGAEKRIYTYFNKRKKCVSL